MPPRRKAPAYSAPNDEYLYQSLPTPKQYHPELPTTSVDPSVQRYSLQDQPAPVLPSERYAYEPAEMNYAELEDAVARLEEQVSPKSQYSELASDTATLISSRAATIIPQNSGKSKESASSGASGATFIESAPQWSKVDEYAKATYDYAKTTYDHGNDFHEKERYDTVSLDDPVPTSAWPAGPSRVYPTDPFADPVASNTTRSYTPPEKPRLATASFQRRQIVTSRAPVPKFSTLDAIIEARSFESRSMIEEPPYPEPGPSNAFDHDPENHALDATPDKYHTRPLRMRSRSPSLSPSRSPSPDPTVEEYDIPRPRSVSTQYERPGGSLTTPERRALLAVENRPPSSSLSPKRESPLGKTVTTVPPALSAPSRLNPASAPASPMTESPTRHFGPAPRQQQRRHKKGTKKIVPLTHGHFVLELDVPSKLVLPEKGSEEMMTCRYTAVTCDPDNFEENKYFLRQNVLGRETELAIVITLYNEDEILLCRTLFGVMKNIQELCKRKASRTWGEDAWKKVVVVIVADGRKVIHPRVLDCLAALGVYQPGKHMNSSILGEPVTAHLFEYTTSMALDPALHFQLMMPTQVIFCLKEKNQKKINSHRWFFNAFGRLLQPNICILLDVGTRPGSKSLYRLWKTFDLNSNVGGACGEIAAYKGAKWKALLNPLVAAQNFEYKMSNILDKPMESIMGYISVLPGAFSAYRYIALQNDKNGRGPLDSYFKGEILTGREHDIFRSNMYLAEDRILCFELVAKSNASWVLRYVKGAVGETDVPDALPELILQRRRWLNGSFFAAVYSLAHIGQILNSGHSYGRKTVLMVESFYNVVNLVFTWFGIANYYLFFVILTSSLEDPAMGLKGIGVINSIVQYFYGGLVAACFLFSMGNKPRASKWKYKSVAIFFAILNVYLIAAAVVCSVQVSQSSDSGMYAKMMLSLIATFGLWVAASVLAFDPWHIVTSGLQYIFLSPFYITTLQTYALCNLDDISWGTKQEGAEENDLGAVSQTKTLHSHVVVDVEVGPDDLNAQYLEALDNLRTRKPVTRPTGDRAMEQEQEAKDYYANVRTNVLLAWVLSNGLLVVTILSGGSASSTFNGSNDGARTRVYMTFILVFVAMTSAIRFLGSTMFLIAWIFTG